MIKKTIFFAFVMLASATMLAQTTITGVVKDAQTGETLLGANIKVSGKALGTTSDFDGKFLLKVNEAPPFTIEISMLGFKATNVEITKNNQEVMVSLQEDSTALEEIVFSASRRRQKVQEAPASVSIITPKDILNSAAVVDPVMNLANIAGVQIQQQSANSINIEMRAGSGIFGTSTFPILDYRYLVTPASGQFNNYQTGMSNIDIQRVEVVRGAASALYGPGVTSGVVHFMSKSAIDYPGTTVEMLGGTLNTTGMTVRHAFKNDNDKFGFKVNVRYQKGTDFQLDPVADADFIASQQTTISQPAIVNGRVDPTQPGELLLTLSDLDDNGDGNPIATEYLNYSANVHLEFRPNDNTTAFLSGGYASGGGLMFNSQGVGYSQGKDYWTQARIQSGGLFAQVFYNYNNGGDAENPTFLYASGLRQVAKRSSLEGQLQYNFDIPNFLNSNFTIGSDYRNTKSDSANTLFGINEDRDDYIITGAYLQGTSVISDKLELTYAGRYDKFNFIDEGAFAPRVALVYKANENHTFRASFNRANTGPTALQQNIDFPVSVLAPGIADVWLSGQYAPQVFPDNPTIDLAVPGLPDLPYGATSFPLAYAYGAVAQPTLEALYGGLAGNPLLPVVQNFFNGYVPSGGTGQLVGYNLFNGEPMDELVGTGRSAIETLNSFEVGYKGLIANKLSVALDVYTYERKGFTQFTAIGPTFNLVGADIANDLGAQVGADFASDPGVIGAVTGAVQAQYTAAGIPQAIWDTGAPAGALFPGSPAIAPIGTVINGTIATAAGAVGGAFTQGGAAFEGAVSPLYPIFGTVETTSVPQGDGLMHIPAGYRRFDGATRSHFGADLAMEYFLNDDVTLWLNTSWLSQTEWIPGESNDDGLPFSSYLNAPKFKYRAGVQYAKDKVRGAIAFQHDDAFNSNQGFFSGRVQEKNLFDVNIGYNVSDNLKLDLSATNVLDQKYRAFPNMPVIGRRTVLKLTFDY
ncbi:MAG: TonB-dependent receptor [Flavobacteriaceae bacterium]